MKKYLLAVKATFSLLLLGSGLAAAQPTTPNLLINGDFEDRNHAPRGQSNIGPVDRTHPYDDLKNWYHPGAAPYYALNSSDDSPDYLASDATDPNVNTNTILSGYGYGGFPSHSGISCVGLLRHNQDRDIRYDEFVTQQLGQALVPGHLYHAEFWVLRIPGGPFHNKLSLNITDADPIFDANANQNKLIPSPGNKVIESADIQQRLVWTKVSGDIVIPGSETNNRWVTIGFTREGPGLDATLQDDYPLTGIYYAIDDVSLVDRGIPCPSNLALTAYVDGQQIAPSSTPSQGSSAEVNIYTPVTFGVSGNYVGTCTWSVYTSAGPYSYISSTSGNTFTITPRAPQSPTAPGGATNSAQYYGITCTVTYPGCGTSSTLEFGLYSKQSNSGGGGGGGDQGDPDLGRLASPTGAYPNPAAEAITIPEGAESATLVNDKGKVLGKSGKNGKVDVQSLPDGLYNLQMMQNGKLINQRIQVKH